jgi:hypothetical protein
MAIFILAIGFLSLAAVFPAGIELQRRGSDDLEGVTAANDIYSELMGNPLLASDRLNEGFSSMVRENTNRPNDGWMPDFTPSADTDPDPVKGDPAEGYIAVTVLVDVANDPFEPAPLTANVNPDFVYYEADRVWPSLGDPRFVWDLLVRRPDSTTTPLADGSDAARHMAGDVQLALILRRVQPEFIRIMNEATNIDVLDLPRPPIAEPNGADYEAPRMPSLTNVIRYDPGEVEGRRLEWIGSGNDADLMLAALSEPRQWLLDSDGNAWKITRIRNIDGDTYIEFAPEPTEKQAERFNDTGVVPGKPALTFVYCITPPVLVDVRTFKSGAGL